MLVILIDLSYRSHAPYVACVPFTIRRMNLVRARSVSKGGD